MSFVIRWAIELSLAISIYLEAGTFTAAGFILIMIWLESLELRAELIRRRDRRVMLDVLKGCGITDAKKAKAVSETAKWFSDIIKPGGGNG